MLTGRLTRGFPFGQWLLLVGLVSSFLLIFFEP